MSGHNLKHLHEKIANECIEPVIKSLYPEADVDRRIENAIRGQSEIGYDKKAVPDSFENSEDDDSNE